MTQPQAGQQRTRLQHATLSMLKHLIGREDLPADQLLRQALRGLAKWRSTVVAKTLINTHGAVVLSGPFAGMRYLSQQSEGSLAARLLGCYEQELHADIEALIADRIEAVIDVGCAEGYYAVGFARRMPWAEIHARDTKPAAQKQCAELAQANGVAERVRIGGLFDGAGFTAFAGRKTLVFCDIEGGEVDLLNPEAYPALCGCQVIVECHRSAGHRLNGHHVADLLARRFQLTHRVTRHVTQPRAAQLPPEAERWEHLDQLLAVWEWRSEPTPWLVMRPNNE